MLLCRLLRRTDTKLIDGADLYSEAASMGGNEPNYMVLVSVPRLLSHHALELARSMF